MATAVAAPMAPLAAQGELTHESKKRAWADAALSCSVAVSGGANKKRSRNIETLVHTGLLHLGAQQSKAASAMFERAWKELDETARGPRAKARKRCELSGLLGVCGILKAERGEKGEKGSREDVLAEARRMLEAAAAAAAAAAAGEGGGEGDTLSDDVACWMNCIGLAHVLSGDAAAAAVWFQRAAQTAPAAQYAADARCNAALAQLVALPGQPPTAPGAAALAALEAAVGARRDLPSRINLTAALVYAGRPADAEPWTDATQRHPCPHAAVLLNNRGVAQAALHRPKDAADTLRRAAVLLPLDDRVNRPDVEFNHAVASHSEQASAATAAPASTAAAAADETQQLPTLEEVVGTQKYCPPPRLGSTGVFAARHAKQPKPGAASAMAYRALGTACNHQGLLNEAVEIDPDDWATWREWGMGLLVGGGDGSDAIEFCKQACRRSDPGNSPAALCALGTAIHLCGPGPGARTGALAGHSADEIYQRAVDQLDRQAAPPSCPVRYQLANNRANWLRCVHVLAISVCTSRLSPV